METKRIIHFWFGTQHILVDDFIKNPKNFNHKRSAVSPKKYSVIKQNLTLVIFHILQKTIQTHNGQESFHNHTSGITYENENFYKLCFYNLKNKDPF